ncbi:MAG: hypothetical protein IPN49_02805 [Saprospiraceae bacterium]|nr:hypothetical protein [Saprospiraceae bacterium]
MKPIIFAIVCVFFSCQNKKELPAADIQGTDTLATNFAEMAKQTDTIEIDAEDAATWLKEVVESHLNDSGFPMEDICTPEYYEYKTDATQVGYDGGMTEEDFVQKWSSAYDVRYAGISVGFLISAQDWGKIEVTRCVPKSKQIPGEITFEVFLTDVPYKMNYKRDITVIPVGKAYLIKNVAEFNE